MVGPDAGGRGEGRADAGRRLTREVIGGERYWCDPSRRPPRRRAPTAYLLPNFDEYLVSFENRSAIAERLCSTGIMTGRGALLAHAIVVDGQVVGGWKRTLTKTAVVVDLRLLVDLTRSEREAVREAAQAFGAFLELPVALRGL